MDIDMKKLILLPLLILIPASGLRAGDGSASLNNSFAGPRPFETPGESAGAKEDGCDKVSDACKPQIKKLTPFLTELKKAETSSRLKQDHIKGPELKQGGPKASLTASTNTIAAAEASAPEGNRTISHPAGLLAALGLLAGLYYFLKENGKTRKTR